jgi:hypothetical protein
LKNRQYNGKKGQKEKTMIYKTPHRKLKIEQLDPYQIPDAREG